MNGLHPKSAGVYLGTPWAPPVAVVEAWLRKVHKDTPEDEGRIPVGSPAGCTAGSGAYRKAVLTTMGLDEDVLA